MNVHQTQAERITALEVEIASLKEEVKGVSDKLDSLISLRDKGQGVFWAASAIFGTVIVTAVSTLFDWLKG